MPGNYALATKLKRSEKFCADKLVAVPDIVATVWLKFDLDSPCDREPLATVAILWKPTLTQDKNSVS